MNKVLRKRLLRDLRANSGRYLALFLLFVMGLYLVVSIVGSSEMIIQGTEKQKAVNMVEDGQFSVFSYCHRQNPSSPEGLLVLLQRHAETNA